MKICQILAMPLTLLVCLQLAWHLSVAFAQDGLTAQDVTGISPESAVSKFGECNSRASRPFSCGQDYKRALVDEILKGTPATLDRVRRNIKNSVGLLAGIRKDQLLDLCGEPAETYTHQKIKSNQLWIYRPDTPSPNLCVGGSHFRAHLDGDSASGISVGMSPELGTFNSAVIESSIFQANPRGCKIDFYGNSVDIGERYETTCVFKVTPGERQMYLEDPISKDLPDLKNIACSCGADALVYEGILKEQKYGFETENTLYRAIRYLKDHKP